MGRSCSQEENSLSITITRIQIPSKAVIQKAHVEIVRHMDVPIFEGDKSLHLQELQTKWENTTVPM